MSQKSSLPQVIQFVSEALMPDSNSSLSGKQTGGVLNTSPGPVSSVISFLPPEKSSGNRTLP
jgi:hypothetical protein